jgi:hypothetical protein
MRYIKLLLLSTILVFGIPALSFGQTLPICNEKSGLAWDMNDETDMEKYVLYHAPNSGIVKGGTDVEMLDIPHDPSTAIDNGDGTFTVVHKIAMPEGDRFFAVTASDKAKNETDLSNEVGCKVDGTPKTPTIELRFNLG